MARMGRPRTSVETDGWTRENLAWLAGLWDGRGSLTFGSAAWLMSITGPRDVIERVREVTGFGAVREMDEDPDNPNSVRWRSSSHAVPALLIAMWPWMGEGRREQAVRVIGGQAWG